MTYIKKETLMAKSMTRTEGYMDGCAKNHQYHYHIIIITNIIFVSSTSTYHNNSNDTAPRARRRDRASKPHRDRTYTNIIHWNELEKGGHFAAFEQPKTFVDEVRACFRLVR